MKIARYEHLHLFPQCFQRLARSQTRKIKGLFGMGVWKDLPDDIFELSMAIQALIPLTTCDLSD